MISRKRNPVPRRQPRGHLQRPDDRQPVADWARGGPGRAPPRARTRRRGPQRRPADRAAQDPRSCAAIRNHHQPHGFQDID